MKNSERREYWKRVVEDQERSGRSVRDYCQRQEVGEHSFYLWRRRFAQEVGESRIAETVKFALVENRAQVAMTASTGAAGVEVVLNSGERLRVAPGADAETLRMIVAVLRESR